MKAITVSNHKITDRLRFMMQKLETMEIGLELQQLNDSDMDAMICAETEAQVQQRMISARRRCKTVSGKEARSARERFNQYQQQVKSEMEETEEDTDCFDVAEAFAIGF